MNRSTAERISTENPQARQGRLTARPRPVSTGAQARGLQRLGLSDGRDGLLFVPAGYSPDRPAPLVLMLHGSGGDARNGLLPLQKLADGAGTLLLAVDSRDYTWDIVLGAYGPDVAFIDRALGWTFERYHVDPARVAVEGFSDGASYALSLGIANGDLFTHVLAFSPGFAAPPSQAGEPRLFVSHGLNDRVLPIDACSRKLTPKLERAGYELRYREFNGPHTVPAEIAREALDWFVGGGQG
jgi:phospholipase/carboxylesterase